MGKRQPSLTRANTKTRPGVVVVTFALSLGCTSIAALKATLAATREAATTISADATVCRFCRQWLSMVAFRVSEGHTAGSIHAFPTHPGVPVRSPSDANTSIRRSRR